ncbi:MAG: TM2 domain-containing protein [Magnetococcales bacterium]|nr:TM2 domain-containing protein [Magnetococcales bacterium]
MVFCRHCGKELNESVSPCPHCGVPTSAVQPVRKGQTVATVLCLFLGGMGGHRFYLGPTWVGVVYLLLCWTGIPSLVAMVETFIIAFTSQENWARKYNNGTITPPAHVAIKILVLVIPILMIAGIATALLVPGLVEQGVEF